MVLTGLLIKCVDCNNLNTPPIEGEAVNGADEIQTENNVDSSDGDSDADNQLHMNGDALEDMDIDVEDDTVK